MTKYVWVALMLSQSFFCICTFNIVCLCSKSHHGVVVFFLWWVLLFCYYVLIIVLSINSCLYFISICKCRNQCRFWGHLSSSVDLFLSVGVRHRVPCGVRRPLISSSQEIQGQSEPLIFGQKVSLIYFLKNLPLDPRLGRDQTK